MRNHSIAILCAGLVLSGCEANNTDPNAQQTGEESLPQPVAAGGSVTGMPTPGRPSPAPAPQSVVDLAIDADVADSRDVDPALPVAPPTITVDGALGKPPADTMPVMPAYPPETTEVSQGVPPPES